MSIYDFTIKAQDGSNVSMSEYKGKVLVIVNTATGCGFTPQYDPLQDLYEEHQKDGLEILDFPCNQFANQAPGTDEEIHSFCTGRFGITFPQFSKIDVNGENADPLFKYLTENTSFAGFGKGMFITALSDGVNQTVINTPEQFSDYMKTTHPDQTIEVTYYIYNTEDKTFSAKQTKLVTLSSNGDVGYMGIAMTLSGISFTTPEIMLDSGINPFHGREGFREIALGMLGYVSQPFRGFSPVPESVTWWYDSPLSNDEVFWIIIWIIYWIFWLDIVLAISNALPAMPFDGGLLMMGVLDWIYEKSGVPEGEERDRKVGRVGSMISYTMLFILILVLVAIII